MVPLNVIILIIAGLEITFATFPIMVIGNHDFLPIKQKYGRSGGFA
jgi:hypothetical protein